MSVPSDTPAKRPIQVAEILSEDLATACSLSVSSLAAALGVSRQTARGLLQERRSLSPEMAVRLAVLFGDAPESWVTLPQTIDESDSDVSVAEDLQRLRAWHFA